MEVDKYFDEWRQCLPLGRKHKPNAMGEIAASNFSSLGGSPSGESLKEDFFFLMNTLLPLVEADVLARLKIQMLI